MQPDETPVPAAEPPRDAEAVEALLSAAADVICVLGAGHWLNEREAGAVKALALAYGAVMGAQ